ncbi:MAG: SIMPL domain-containing protein [Flavobacteriales bacterium]
MKNNIILFTLITCLSMLLFSCGGGGHKSKKTKKIEVTGSAEMEVVPNEIYMTFTLKEYMKNGKKVAIEGVKTDFLALCKTAGIADSNISTAGYAGNEQWNYWWWYNRRHNTDVFATITYTVMVSSTEKLDQIVAGLTDDAMQNFYISKTSHSDMEKLRKEVKTNALQASKDKATYLAQSIGEQLGEALLIQEVEDSYYSDVSGLSNGISQRALESNYGFNDYESANVASPQFEKIKLRYEMKCEFALK